MDAYEKGGFGYHTTMPTDALRAFNNVVNECNEVGLASLKVKQQELGEKARAMFESKGLRSVAHPNDAAPGVLVYYSPLGFDNGAMVKSFLDEKIQIAAGVPWKVDEPAGLMTFRIGLFGLEKMADVDGTVAALERGYDALVNSKK